MILPRLAPRCTTSISQTVFPARRCCFRVAIPIPSRRFATSPPALIRDSPPLSTGRGRRPSISNKRYTSTMENPGTGQVAGAAGEKKAKKPPPPVRPSSSILLLSPTNEVLLLHRVHTSSSFASAHVFPGGNLSSFHEGPLPTPDTPAMHVDGPAYRLAAIRETFEESGILLARRPGQTREQGLLQIPDDVREAARKQIHGNQVKFAEWVKSVGGEPDVENLIPFTRWITPHGPPKRFTTQMYLYMLPLQTDQHTLLPTPTHDGGVEHTAATFDNPHTWLAQAQQGAIILFPPQFYLLHHISSFVPPSSPEKSTPQSYQAQRTALHAFLHQTPTTTGDAPPGDKTAQIPWSDKVISPTSLFMRKGDGKLVLGLDKPGPELRGSERGGDAERVVLVKFAKGGPSEVEVRNRGEVLAEERGGKL